MLHFPTYKHHVFTDTRDSVNLDGIQVHTNLVYMPIHTKKYSKITKFQQKASKSVRNKAEVTVN